MPSITNPTAGDLHVNRPLTNFSQKYLQDERNFVALRAMPNTPVQNKSDLYYVFNRGDFFRDQAIERADGAESAGGGFKLSTNPYFARVYAFHKDVTDQQRANQDAPIDLDNSATQYVSQKLLIRRERLWAATYFATGIWGNDVTPTRWDQTTSDPIVDVRTAARTIHQRTGFRPNKMVVGRDAYDLLLDNDALLSRITGGATREMPAQVLRTLIAQLFELEEIFVMDGVVNTAVEGATDAYSFIGGDNALVYYAPNTVSLNQPTAGLQFSWTGMVGSTPSGTRIKRFRMEQNEADRIEGQMAFDYRVTASELGYFLSDLKT